MTLTRWMIDLPTRVHLWTAERELRLASPPDPAMQSARLHQLDVLRDYRRSRGFPRNTVSRRPAPVFIDDDGRRCAVAHLMIESGASEAAQHVAATTPYARIHELDPEPLDHWARPNGLARDELARIQPYYYEEQPPTVSTALVAVTLVGLTGASVFAALGSMRLLAKTALRRLAVRHGRRIGWAAIIAGVAALAYIILAFDMMYGPSNIEAHVSPAIPEAAIVAGVMCLVATWRLRRARLRG